MTYFLNIFILIICCIICRIKIQLIPYYFFFSEIHYCTDNDDTSPNFFEKFRKIFFPNYTLRHIGHGDSYNGRVVLAFSSPSSYRLDPREHFSERVKCTMKRFGLTGMLTVYLSLKCMLMR